MKSTTYDILPVAKFSNQSEAMESFYFTGFIHSIIIMEMHNTKHTYVYDHLAYSPSINPLKQ